MPANALTDPINAKTRRWLWRADYILCAPIPSAIVIYLGGERPPIIVEVALPWHDLELAAMAWHRSQWMSCSGLNPELARPDPAQFYHSYFPSRLPSRALLLIPLSIIRAFEDG
jgi:hypothetical protein